MMDKVLLIVDMQNDFCPGGALAVNDGDKIVPSINTLMERFPLVVATQDWHPANHISFADNHPGSRAFEVKMVNGLEQVLWPVHCVAGTAGADFHPGLNTVPVNLILRKGTRGDMDSYSAFMENDRQTSTGLAAYLRGLCIKEVFLCGLAFDVCVFYSALDSVKYGFRTYVIDEACRGVDIPAGNCRDKAALMEKAGVKFVKAGELWI